MLDQICPLPIWVHFIAKYIRILTDLKHLSSDKRSKDTKNKMRRKGGRRRKESRIQRGDRLTQDEEELQIGEKIRRLEGRRVIQNEAK